jgi:integrase/recombinase XerD
MLVGMSTRWTPDEARQMEALAAGWLRVQRSPHTQSAYGADLAHFRAWCLGNRRQPLDFTADDLAAYRFACEAAGSSAASVARRLSAIASFMRFAAGHGVGSDAEVVSSVERPRASPVSATAELSDDDAAALLSAADADGSKAAFIVRLFMLNGLKVGEAVAANASDLSDRPRMTLRLQPAHAARVVVFHRDTAKAGRKYLNGRRSGPLLTREQRDDDARLTRFGVDYIVKRVAEAAGIGVPVSGNTLRRRFITAAHAEGTDLDDIRRRVGHRDSRTTRRLL